MDMRQRMRRRDFLKGLGAAGVLLQLSGHSSGQTHAMVHVWEKVEITLTAEKVYDNPYAEVDVWVQLQGPGGFNKHVWGFWDGGLTFRIRLVAPTPGRWTWATGSSVDDPGLRGQRGSFTARAWSEEEKRANPNRRGFLRPTSNGHALNYAYGGVLSGGLGGHIYGTNAWDGDVAAVEPRKENWGEGNEYIHEALLFKVGGQMQHLRAFILSEGPRYQDLELVPEDIMPRTSVSGPRGYTMSGLAFMMRTPDKALAMLYFEDSCKKPALKNMAPDAPYAAEWFNPRTGEWSSAGTGLLRADHSGKLQLPDFPGGLKTTREDEDWALKLVLRD
jgi:hypothetical protein